MSKFNTKSEKVKPTVTNCMGEMAYQLTKKEELISTVMTTFLSDGYYESEKEIVNRIKLAMEEVDPLFCAKLAIYARNEGNLRSVTHLMSAFLAKRVSGLEWAKRYYDKIVVRPDDMSEILSCYGSINNTDPKNIRPIPNSIKKGFKSALERLDAYQIDKYKMNNRSLSMIDLVNIFKPHPSKKNAEAYHRLMNNMSLEGTYSTKILEKELSKLGQKADTLEEKNMAKNEAISSVLDNVSGMPIMNLLRNLKNILLYAPEKVDEAVKQLINENKIMKSRLLPFRFSTAYEEIENMTYKHDAKESKMDSKIVFEKDIKQNEISHSEFIHKKEEILNAIEKALEISCKNIPVLDGNVAILIDHSGSCRGDGGGLSRVSAFSKTTTAMIGNLFGSMIAYKQDNVYIGLFGDRLINVPVDRSKSLLDFNKSSFDMGAQCGGGTEQGIYDFFKEVNKNKQKIDNVVVFSDCQIGSNGSTSWYGHSCSSPKFVELIKEFKNINPMCNIIVVNLRQYKGNNVFHKSQKILNIAGWSSNIFDVISSNCKGFDAMIKEIEAINI